jgi:hypothetical protein
MAKKGRPMTLTIEVDNPQYQPANPVSIKRIEVTRALRDDPLGRLHARRQIGEAQYHAGREWQALYEAAAVGGTIRSVDFTNEPVDGSKAPREPITDRTQKAMREIIRLDRSLGQDGCALIRDVLADRLSMDQVAYRRGECSRAALDYYGRRFRECLNTLARELGYRT